MTQGFRLNFFAAPMSYPDALARPRDRAMMPVEPELPIDLAVAFCERFAA